MPRGAHDEAVLRSVSVVVPVYNSERSLPVLVERLEPVLSFCSSHYEIILVNDGSRDSSWNIIEELAEANTRVRGISLLRNYGQHSAVLCGIRAAQNEIIVTMDDDLQHPPEEIPVLIRKLDEGFDVVYGTPRAQHQGWWRDLASLVVKLSLRSAMGITIARDVSAFRAFKAYLRTAFDNYQSPQVVIDVLLSWATSRFSAVEVRHDARAFGRSNYTITSLIAFAVDMTTGFTILPLRIASFMGFATCLFGAAVLLFVIGRYALEGQSSPGFPFLASIIAIFSGAQLLAIGIMGEYLARLHIRAMERPSYVIVQAVGGEANVDPRKAWKAD